MCRRATLNLLLNRISNINFYYQLFKILKLFYTAVDRILDIFFGYSLVSGWQQERSTSTTNLMKNKFCKKSANLTKILARGPYPPSYIVTHDSLTLKYYILKHEEYVDPEDYLLKNDLVSLMGLDENKVWFAVSSPQEDPCDIRKFPFLFMGQYYTAQKMLILDHTTFHKMAEKSLGPSKNCILISHTGRCGSTLLNQIFGKLPETISMSEPFAFFNVHQLYCQNKITKEKYLKLLKSCVKLQYKPTIQRNTERYAIKLSSSESPMVCDIHNIFGKQIKIIFQTRTPKPSILSYARVVKIGNKEALTNFWFNSIPIPYDKKYDEFLADLKTNVKKMSVLEIIALKYASSMTCHLTKKGIYSYINTYEEMINDKELATTKLFAALDIPKNFVPDALTAFEKNSQNNLFQLTSQSKGELFPVDDWLKVDKIFESFQLPLKTDLNFSEFSLIVHNN